jgi:hypothetical protein
MSSLIAFLILYVFYAGFSLTIIILSRRKELLLKSFMAIRLSQQTVMAVTELPQIAVCRISHSPFFFC